MKQNNTVMIDWENNSAPLDETLVYYELRSSTVNFPVPICTPCPRTQHNTHPRPGLELECTNHKAAMLLLSHKLTWNKTVVFLILTETNSPVFCLVN